MGWGERNKDRKIKLFEGHSTYTDHSTTRKMVKRGSNVIHRGCKRGSKGV